ncbi:unannotated protein [freshwater metagenome]|uniref:Unannotated protein n=1 Tax=freshwater metagenome TaxID=449393 RepID=A0A6J7CUF8_9ZZZZ
MRLGLRDESVDEARQFDRQRPCGIPKVHARQCRNLVVTRAPGADASAQLWSNVSDEGVFESAVDILVGFLGDQCS